MSNSATPKPATPPKAAPSTPPSSWSTPPPTAAASTPPSPEDATPTTPTSSTTTTTPPSTYSPKPSRGTGSTSPPSLDGRSSRSDNPPRHYGRHCRRTTTQSPNPIRNPPTATVRETMSAKLRRGASGGASTNTSRPFSSIDAPSLEPAHHRSLTSPSVHPDNGRASADCRISDGL